MHQPVMSWGNACSTCMHKPVRCMHLPVTSQANACTYCKGSKVSSLSRIYLYSSYFGVIRVLFWNERLWLVTLGPLWPHLAWLGLLTLRNSHIIFLLFYHILFLINILAILWYPMWVASRSSKNSAIDPPRIKMQYSTILSTHT